MPFDHVGLTPQQITANSNLYDVMTISTDSGWYLTIPSSNATNFVLSPWFASFSQSQVDTLGAIVKFGIHPALNASDGWVYLGLMPPPQIEGNYQFLTEFHNFTNSLPYNCYYKQQWSDYLPVGCIDCGQPTSVNTCPSPIPNSLRWLLVYDSTEQAWAIYSGISRTRVVIVYPSFSSFPVQAPSNNVPYLALTNNSFFSGFFDIYNHSTTPPTKLYPLLSSLCRRMFACPPPFYCF
jgi:hypothetical protein